MADLLIKATAEFRQWLDETLPKLKAIAGLVIAAKKEHGPMMLMFTQDGEMAAVPIGPFFSAGNHGKDIAAELHRELASSPLVKVAVMLNEVWVVSRPKDHPDAVLLNRSLEHEPDRIEGIMWNCLMGRQQLVVICPIDRATNTLGKEMITDPHDVNTLAYGRIVGEPLPERKN